MENLTTNQYSLSQIRLLNLGRPLYIYFDQYNESGRAIRMADDGLLYFHYYDRGIVCQIHSDSGPAIHYTDGSVAWVMNGRYHRDSREPAIIDRDLGMEQYWEHGMYLGSSQTITTPDHLEVVTDIAQYSEKTYESDDGSSLLVLAAIGAVGLASFFGKSSIVKKKQRAASNTVVAK